jgi:membrane protease YdiL (CAAX protease family)
MENILERHTLLKSIILHLLPGLLTGSFYFAIVPFVIRQGFPSVMALTLAGIFVLIPFELGFLLYQKRLKNEKLFNGVIKYCKHIPVWQYFVWVPVILILSGLVFTAFNFTTDFFISFFNWIPSDMFVNMGLSEEYSKQKLIITYGSFFFFVVLILSTIEELYFRGYLLPRMPSKLKGWTLIVHSGLFALYNIWSPWMFVVRFFGILPLTYIVKHKENILLGVISHCLLNSIDFIIASIFILNY